MRQTEPDLGMMGPLACDRRHRLNAGARGQLTTSATRLGQKATPRSTGSPPRKRYRKPAGYNRVNIHFSATTLLSIVYTKF